MFLGHFYLNYNHYFQILDHSLSLYIHSSVTYPYMILLLHYCQTGVISQVCSSWMLTSPADSLPLTNHSSCSIDFHDLLHLLIPFSIMFFSCSFWLLSKSFIACIKPCSCMMYLTLDLCNPTLHSSLILSHHYPRLLGLTSLHQSLPT